MGASMKPGGEPIAALNSVTVQNDHGRSILDRASLQLRSGEVTCLVGRSGSGKTTAALLLLGLLPPGMHLAEGHVEFQGQVLDAGQAGEYAGLRGKGLAIVFQDPYTSLNPMRRCGPQVEDALEIHGAMAGNAAKARVLEQFKYMGFMDTERIYRSFPSQLSGGQRQRVVLALVTILEPKVLIADEPTASLDIKSQEQVVGLLRSLARERDTAVLLISHDVGLVRSSGDTFIEIRDGGLYRVDCDSLSLDLRRVENDRSNSRSPLLEVRALTKSYARTAVPSGSPRSLEVLRDVSLHTGAGEIVGIFGPSGVGKTTLGRCIAGLESYQAGSVLLEDLPVEPRGLRPHDGRVQMVYQSPASSLHPGMRVSETIEEALRQAGVPRPEYEREVASLLAQVGLPKTMSVRYPDSLSGGEKQRVVIARCLARRPRLIIADEPTASLDEKNKHTVLALLRRVAEDRRLAVVLITHERDLAWRYCDRVFELGEGGLASLEAPETEAVG